MSDGWPERDWFEKGGSGSGVGSSGVQGGQNDAIQHMSRVQRRNGSEGSGELLRGGVNLASVIVGADVCLRCGERLYSKEVVSRFEQIRRKLAQPGSVRIPVFRTIIPGFHLTSRRAGQATHPGI